MDKIPASWQAGFVVLARPVLSKIGIEVDMARVYRELGVGNASAYDSARILMKKMSSPSDLLSVERKKNQELDRNLRLTKFHNDVLLYHANDPRAWTQSEERHQCSDEFKAFLLTKKSEYALEWAEISLVLGIPEETLKKFKHQVEEKGPGDGGPPRTDLPEAIVDQLRSYFQGRSGKATAKSFADKHPQVLDELKMTYAQFANLLLRLGFTSPKGIILNNTGLDKIERFAPHAAWGTDGKLMKIIINGETFRFIWQCLIDYKSTVLVGGLVSENETTDNLLEAIRESKKATGVAPMAIVIDGRLSENLPAIREYLDEMGIEIIRTYPGNPKSNGITEGNFGIFEKWVGGEIIVNGKTAKELSFSFANVLTQVFTQLRNNQPRKGLGLKTANEVLASRPKLSAEEESTIRGKIQALANRFKNEQAVPVVSEQKAQAIEQAIATVLPPDLATFRKRLMPSMITCDLILAAIAIYKKQQTKHPEKVFTHTYFGGILRNLVDQRSVEMLYTQLDQVYADHWARMANSMNQSIKTETPEQTCQRLSQEYLGAKIPAHGWITLVHLQTAFMVAARGCAIGAASLRDRLAEMTRKTKMACPEKRQRLLQKLFECEAVVKQLTMTTQRTFVVETSPLF